MAQHLSIYIITEHETTSQRAASLLEDAGYHTQTGYPSQLINISQSKEWDMVVLVEPKDPCCFAAFFACPFVVVSERDEAAPAVAALKAGAREYLLTRNIEKLPAIAKSLIEKDARKRLLKSSNSCSYEVEDALAGVRLAEAQFRQSERRNEQMAELAPVGIFRLNGMGLIAYANKATAEIMGYSKEDLEGKNWDRLFNASERKRFYSLWSSHKNQPLLTECYLSRKDGEQIWAMVQLAPESLEEDLGYIGTLINITRQKQAEQSRQESLEQYRHLFNTMLDAYVYHEAILDENGRVKDIRYLEANPVFEKYMGVTRDQILGKTEQEVFPDTEPFWYKVFNKVMITDGPVEFERNLKITGRIYAFKAYRCEGNTFSCTFADVTESKRAKEALVEERNFTNAVLDTAGALIMTLDPMGRIVRFNKTAEQLTGYHFEELKGKRPWESGLVVEERKKFAEELFKQATQEPNSQFEATWLTIDDEPRLISWTNSPLYDTTGTLTHLVAVGYDVTEQRLQEREKEFNREQLFHTDKLVSLGTLVAGVAHEINNPNNYISLNSSIMSDIWKGVQPVLEAVGKSRDNFRIGSLDYETVCERLPVLLEAIQDGSLRIKNIVNNLKDFARQESTDMGEMVDVNAAVKRAVSLTSLKKATPDLNMRLARTLPIVLGARQRIEQVLINLMINACEALPNNKLPIDISTGVTRDGQYVVIKVCDQGMGIPNHLMRRITDPFFTTKRDSGGTGLGLSISDSIIREHGGHMSFESKPGKGTTVTIKLPVADENQREKVS